MKKPGVAQLKKKADKAFSEFIRRRGADREGFVTCFTCGRRGHWKSMQAGHFVKRSVNLLRYSPINVQVQDYTCNVMRYGEQYLYAQALDNEYGEGTAEALMAQRFTSHKFTIDELEAIITQAQTEIATYPN